MAPVRKTPASVQVALAESLAMKSAQAWRAGAGLDPSRSGISQAARNTSPAQRLTSIAWLHSTTIGSHPAAAAWLVALLKPAKNAMPAAAAPSRVGDAITPRRQAAAPIMPRASTPSTQACP